MLDLFLGAERSGASWCCWFRVREARMTFLVGSWVRSVAQRMTFLVGSWVRSVAQRRII
jgi:hypothetical protein